jgi:hypothetical protein
VEPKYVKILKLKLVVLGLMKCNVGSKIFIGDVGLGHKTLNSSLWGEPFG